MLSAMKTLAELPVTEKEKAAIEEAKRLIMEKFPVVQVILFGSKARGDDDEESDIDLLLLTSRSLDWRERQCVGDVLFEIEMRYDVVIGFMAVPEGEWRHGLYTVLPIHDDVEREGMPL